MICVICFLLVASIDCPSFAACLSRCYDESLVRRRARARRHPQERAVAACHETAALPRHEQRLVEARLQGRRLFSVSIFGFDHDPASEHAH